MNDITIFTYDSTNIRTITTEDGEPPVCRIRHRQSSRVPRRPQHDPPSGPG